MNEKATVFKVTEFEKKVCELRKKGMSKQAIAELLRISQYKVRTILERNNVNVRIEHGRKRTII